MIISGYGQVVRQNGEVLLSLGKKVVPHGQELRVAKFRADLPGLQMAIRYNGHNAGTLIADRGGKILCNFQVDPSHRYIGLEAIQWEGPGKAALLYAPSALWSGYGKKVVEMPDLPAESKLGMMGFYHCIPAQVDGSKKESIVLYDPFAQEIFVYGKAPLRTGVPNGYVHTQRQYNVRLMD
jgi:hypothetical protein